MQKSLWRRMGAAFAGLVMLGVLLVPTAAAAGNAGFRDASPATAETVHIVRLGETLSQIARSYGVNIYVLAKVNGIGNLNNIYAGQRLVIPRSEDGQAPVYTVRYGDTLANIAYRYHTSVGALLSLNHLTGDKIYAGQVLRISGSRPGEPPQPPALPVAPVSGDWVGQYYESTDLSGRLALERREPAIDFDWGLSSPARQIMRPDRFSARWTRTYRFAEGTYRIEAQADDGVRVYLDGSLIVDAWRVQALTTHSADFHVLSGEHTLTVEYFEAEGTAEIHFMLDKLG